MTSEVALSNKEIAREWLSIGANPIPLIKGTKKPSIKWTEWQEQRVNPSDIDEWWTEPNQFDVGIITGKISGISVVDLDLPKGSNKSGWDSINQLGIPLPKDDVLIGRSKSGGYHVFLEYDPRYKNGSGILEGVDIRNDGGYIRVTNGYSIQKGEINRDYFPKFFDDRLLKKNPSKSIDLTNIPEPYQRYLNASEGHRNDSIASLSGLMNMNGKGQYDAFSLARMVNETFSPPLEQDELLKIVKSIYKYDNSNEEESKGNSLKDAIVTGSHVMANKSEKSWLWEGWIPKKLVTILGGFEGKGKSYALLDIASRITNGSKFPDGSKAPKGNVLWLGFEDGIYDDMTYRMKVLGTNQNNIFFLDWGKLDKLPSLQDEDTRKIITDLIIENKIVLTIIDPVTSMSGGAKDNDANDISQLLKSVAKIPENTNSSMVLIKHFGKDNSRRGTASHLISGSHQWGASARSVIQVVPHYEKDIESKTRRILAIAKSNWKSVAPLVFNINKDGSGIEWSEGDENFDVLNHMSNKPNLKDSCVNEIVEMLKEKSLDSKELKQRLSDKGYKEITIERSIKKGNEEARFIMDKLSSGHVNYYHLEDTKRPIKPMVDGTPLDNIKEGLEDVEDKATTKASRPSKTSSDYDLDDLFKINKINKEGDES